MLQIGPYKLANPVALAPMAGVTDLPFRLLCKELGAGLVVSEMLSSDSQLWNSRKSSQRRVHQHESEPRSVQIAGSDPKMMALAAQRNVTAGAQIIDINMGCPAKKVCRKAAGSALLRDEVLVGNILANVVAAVEVPVTLKIRTGWSPTERNAGRIARIAQDSGITALAIHGRTRSCKFTGDVEYETIAQICQDSRIPVFANGDIDSPEKAAAVRAFTGADGVMIGRAAQGRPWLCGQVAHFLEHGTLLPDPTPEQQRDILLRHLQHLHDYYGEYSGLRIARKHLGWYLQRDPLHTAFKQQFNQLLSASEQLDAVRVHFQTSIYKELAA